MNPEQLKEYIKEFYPMWYEKGLWDWNKVLKHLQEKNKEDYDLLTASLNLDKQKDYIGVEESQKILDSI